MHFSHLPMVFLNRVCFPHVAYMYESECVFKVSCKFKTTSILILLLRCEIEMYALSSHKERSFMNFGNEVIHRSSQGKSSQSDQNMVSGNQYIKL